MKLVLSSYCRINYLRHEMTRLLKYTVQLMSHCYAKRGIYLVSLPR